MFINCGKAVQTLCFGSELATYESVEKKSIITSQWNNNQLSTPENTANTQGFPLVFSIFYPCLNTFFTQFPQRLLLLTLIKN